MKGAETISSGHDDGKGFHPIYLWGIFYVLLTYAYPVFWYLTLPKADESVNSDAAYHEMAKAQNGVLGEDLPLVFLGIPLVLLIINIIIACRSKNLNRRRLLNTAQIIKYLLIPFYILGALLIIVLILLMFTPIVIMIFLSPVVITILSIMGWISMAGSAPLMIAYLVKSVRDGKNGKFFAIVVSILQFFLGVDVLSTIICAVRDRK